jgi:hypothetical protein
MSSIVATLVVGTVVDQVDASAGWVKVVTDDRRQGWLRETDLSEVTEAPAPTMAAERNELASEIKAVEQSQLQTLVTQIDQVATTREATANQVAKGWQFATDAAAAVIAKNYTFHAFAALFLYSFLWIPGLVLNIVFLNNANRDQRATGKAPQGKGCLLWLLWVFGILPVVIIVLLLAIGIMVGDE